MADAIAEAQSAVKLAPNSAEVNAALAQALLAAGKPPKQKQGDVPGGRNVSGAPPGESAP